VRVLLRVDSGFAREALMTWCEANRVDFRFGLARNACLIEEIAIDLAWAEDEATCTGRPARRFRDFRWSTLDSWSRRRRIVARPSGPEARLIRASSSPRSDLPGLTREASANASTAPVARWRTASRNANSIYSAGRASAAIMRVNQQRLWFASMAYVLLCALRRIGFAHTQFAQATCGTLRLALLKIGAQVRRSVRRVAIAMASGHPFQNELALAHARIAAAARRTRYRIAANAARRTATEWSPEDCHRGRRGPTLINEDDLFFQSGERLTGWRRPALRGRRPSGS
jgi:hypothetical protein